MPIAQDVAAVFFLLEAIINVHLCTGITPSPQSGRRAQQDRLSLSPSGAASAEPDSATNSDEWRRTMAELYSQSKVVAQPRVNKNRPRAIASSVTS